jgi:hypothetical protein
VNILYSPSLVAFTYDNASYNPNIIFGVQHSPEGIELEPYMLLALRSTPAMPLFVIAHEVGHKIGPIMSRINGHDVSHHYHDLLQCYRDPGSIGLKSGQEEETIADYIASEIVAREISRLPESRRKDAVMASIQFLCGTQYASNSLKVDGSHPSPIYRASGIIGGNPRIRSLLNCSSDSSKYKTCGLDISLISGEGGSRSTPAGSASDSAGGVR